MWRFRRPRRLSRLHQFCIAITCSLTLVLSSAVRGHAAGLVPDTLTHVTGTFLIPEFWGEQRLLDETHLGVIRIGIRPQMFLNYSKAPQRFDWERIDKVVAANAHRTIMVTLSPLYSLPGGRTTAVPGNKQDFDLFIGFVKAFAQRYSKAIEYWQLENEVTAPKNWPPDRYADYAKLLAAFHDAVRSSVPEARIVIAGSPYRVFGKPRWTTFLQAIASGAPGKAHAIDLHYHRTWTDGSAIIDGIATLRNGLARFPALKNLDIVIAENSTWLDRPLRLQAQSDSQQAVYAVESIYGALGSGARFCIFGTLMDRPQWKQDTAPHRFNLNGLYYNSQKVYSSGKRVGPKRVAYAMRLIAELTKDLTSDDIRLTSSGNPNVVRVDVAGKRPYSVLWWNGAGSAAGFVEIKIPVQERTKSVKVVESVPTVLAAWPPKDPFSGFPSIDLPQKDNFVTITLRPHLPVYVFH